MHVGQERVVDLHVETGVDDRLVFLVQAVGEREQQRPSRRRSAWSPRRAARSPARPPAGTRRSPCVLSAAALSVAISRFTLGVRRCR